MRPMVALQHRLARGPALALSLILGAAACSGGTSGSPNPSPSSSLPRSSAPSPAATATSSVSTPSATPTAAPVAYPENIGEGVTIAILDRGIDWTHPDFINEDGTTRIKWILDMSTQTNANWCTADRPAPVEFTEEQINAALESGEPIDHRDAVGHGTATAGMAAGDGSASDGRYRGVAPGADLIIIKLTSEGAPAVGGSAEEVPFNACVDDALEWLEEKITVLDQPTVGIWNAGTQWGPIDGTSVTTRRIAEMFGPDRPGRVWIASSGDEGGLPNHARGEFSPDAHLEVPFQLTGRGDSYPSAWYSGEVSASVTLEFEDGTVVGPVFPQETVTQDGVTITQYEPGAEFYPWQSTSGDRAVYMRITGQSGEGVMRFAATVEGTGTVDVYGDVLGGEPLTSSINFLDHVVPGRLNDTAATVGAVVVGNHVLQERWEAINGRTVSRADEGATGDLWVRSSGGPTRDGRQVMDVTAAGQNAFAALAEGSHWSTLDDVIPEAGGGSYVVFGGTSASAPMVVGTVALMLEVNPSLTAAQVKEILRSTAVSDEFTGEVPNDDWGYGKLDILAAVEAAAGGE